MERLYRAGVTAVNKEHFTTLYSPARTKVITKRNILAGWVKSGLFPFNSDRVFRDVTKPDIAQSFCTAYEDMRSGLQNEPVRTPVTPVTSEDLTSLLNLIKQDPDGEVNKECHLRLIQKLGNAAQTSFARQGLNQEHIEFLSKMNNDAKVRRETKLNILERQE